MRLAIRRPVLEGQPPGVRQKIFLDFDGATFNTGIFGGAGQATLSPLSNFMAAWGLQATDENALIDAVIRDTPNKTTVRLAGAQPGTNPNYDFQILNSRDDADTFGADPLVCG